MLKKFSNLIGIKRNDTKTRHNEDTDNHLPVRHILIDYENLLPHNLDRVQRDHCHIWLFVGKLQNKLNTGLVQALHEFHERAHYIYLDVSQPNALDFHLSYYLGYIAATYPPSHVAILSKDKGYESIMAHAREHHNFLSLTRYDNNALVEQPDPNKSTNTVATPVTAKKPSVSTPFNRCVEEAIIYLTDLTQYHPRMRRRLEKLLAEKIIAPIYQQEAQTPDESQLTEYAEKLVDKLIQLRFISVKDSENGILNFHTDEQALYERMKYFVCRYQPAHVVPLKQTVARNYAHRSPEENEICQLIEKLKQENILNIAKGGHVTYLSIPAEIANVDLDLLENKAIQFIQKRYALPTRKASLINVLGTHLNVKGQNKIIKKVIHRLTAKGLICIDESDNVQYPE